LPKEFARIGAPIGEVGGPVQRDEQPPGVSVGVIDCGLAVLRLFPGVTHQGSMRGIARPAGEQRQRSGCGNQGSSHGFASAIGTEVV